MIYLRNITRLPQWLEDPQQGRRQVEAGALARVSEEQAEALARAEPTKWSRVTAIPLAGDSGGQPPKG